MRLYKVVCPRCGRRLFDFSEGASGVIQVRCGRCKTFNILDLIAKADKDAIIL